MDASMPALVIVVTAPVNCGQELLLDYGPTYWKPEDKQAIIRRLRAERRLQLKRGREGGAGHPNS